MISLYIYMHTHRTYLQSPTSSFSTCWNPKSFHFFPFSSRLTSEPGVLPSRSCHPHSPQSRGTAALPCHRRVISHMVSVVNAILRIIRVEGKITIYMVYNGVLIVRRVEGKITIYMAQKWWAILQLHYPLTLLYVLFR